MDRKEFLSVMGLSAVSGILATCLASCSKDAASANTTGPSNIDFTLDLTQASNASLNINGGYLYSNELIVARTLSGSFIAVQQTCTHERFNIVYQGASHRFYCDGHGGTFNESGAVTGGPPPRALKTYNTSLTGNMLRVYS